MNFYRYFGRALSAVDDLIRRSEEARATARRAAIQIAAETRQRRGMQAMEDATYDTAYRRPPHVIDRGIGEPLRPTVRVRQPVDIGAPPMPVPENFQGAIPVGAEVAHGIGPSDFSFRKAIQPFITPLAPRSVTDPIAETVGAGARFVAEHGPPGITYLPSAVSRFTGVNPEFDIGGETFQPLRHGFVPLSAGEEVQRDITEEGQRIIPAATSPIGLAGAVAFPEAAAFGTATAATTGIAGRFAEEAGFDPRLRVRLPLIGETNIGPRAAGEIIGGFYGGPGRKLLGTEEAFALDEGVQSATLRPGIKAQADIIQNQIDFADKVRLQSLGIDPQAIDQPEVLADIRAKAPDIAAKLEVQAPPPAPEIPAPERPLTPQPTNGGNGIRGNGYGVGEPPLEPPMPPTGAGAEPPIGDPLTRLAEAIRNAGKPTPKQREMFARERALRTAKAASQLERGVAKGQGAAAFAKARRSLAGEFPRPDFAVPAFTEGDMHDLLQRIGTADVSFYTKIGAQDALENLSNGRIPQPAQLSALKATLPGLVSAALSKRPLTQKIWAEVVSSLGLPQAFKASMDFGTRFRQGLVLGWTHPKQWADAWKPMVDSMFSEDAAKAAMAKVEANPWYSISKGKRAGLGLTDVGGHIFKWESLTPGPERVEGFTGLNESFVQRAVNRIPGLQGSQRSFAVDLNKMGMDVYALRAEQMWQSGVRDPAQYKALASVINHARGYGAFRPGRIVEGVNAFFSPRNLVARLQVAIDPLTQPGSLFKPSARQLAAKNLVGMVAGDMSVLGLIAAVGGATGLASVEFNPTKPGADWLKVRVGNTRVDPWGGFLPMARLIARMGAATLTETGVKDTGWNYPRATEELRTFFQNKEAPLVRVFTDAVGISQPFGDPSLLKPSALANLFAPFITQDVWDAVKEHGWVGGVAAGVTAAVGVGVQTYQVPSEERNKLAQDRFGKDYFDLDVDERPQIDADPKMQELNRQIDESQRQRGDEYQQAQDTFEAAAAPIREQQAAIDKAAASGQMDIARWKDQNRINQAQLAQARNDAFRGIDSKQPADPATQPIRAALDNYYAVKVEDFTNPQTMEVDWNGYFAKRDAALAGLNTEQRAAAQAQVEKNLTPFQKQFKEAQRVIDRAPVRYKGLTAAQADRLDTMAREVSDLVPQLREKLGRDVSPTAVAKILASEYAGDGMTTKDMYVWFKRRNNRRYRNPAFYSFLKQNADTLQAFYPDLYSTEAYQLAAGLMRPKMHRAKVAGAPRMIGGSTAGGLGDLTEAIGPLGSYQPISVQ